MLGTMAPTHAGKLVRRMALLAALVTPQVALALTGSSLRDLADPVTPGGILAYRVTLQDLTPPAPPVPTCFNPPAECATFPVSCVGGVCNGGPSVGLACSAPDGSLTTECPGITFVCKRAENEDEYCGTTSPSTPQCIGDSTNGFFCAESANNGTPCGTTEPDASVCDPDPNGSTHPEQSFCLSHPTGICSGGPNFGLTCTAPHGSTTAECPAAPSSPTPTTVTVDLPMPTGTSFIDADNGGSSNGTSVVWTVPAPATCTPNCAPLNARLLVDPLVPEGTVLQSQATTTDVDGFLVSAPQQTTIARMQFRSLSLARGAGAGRGRFAYRTKFSLNATESLDPGNEAFALSVSNASGPLVDFALPAGQVVESSLHVFTYRSNAPGIRALVLREVGPGLWSIRVRAAQLTVPPVTGLTITIDLTIGDDTFSQPARFLVKGGGRRFVATTAP
jgi:hypothetical protein